MKRIFCLAVGLLALSALGARSVETTDPGDDGLARAAAEESSVELAASCTPYLGEQCYWMENTSGSYCWVPATWVGSFQDCYRMDSCDGGLGESGGGCYKWAQCSGCARYPW